MIRTPLILVASFGLLAGCATSSANSGSQNPDAGNVKYDVGQPSSGGSGGGSGDGGATNGGATDGGKAPVKGVDATSTGTAPIGPKVAKKIATAKPPKKDEPVDPKKPPPKRKGRQDPNGLLGEAFTIEATASKLPDFASGSKGLFVTPSLDVATNRFPTAVKVPTALRFTGSLNVTEGHEYKFCTNSSDGAKFMIEGTVVIDNDAVHNAPAEKCEVVSLEPGEYAIEVQSFHVSGQVTIGLLWAVGKDGTPAAIPKANLYKPEGADDKVKATPAK